MDQAKHGPYIASIIQLAVVSLAIEFAWQIMDMRTNEVVKGGTNKISVAMSLVGAGIEDYYDKLRQTVEEELNYLLDMEELEKILLGE